MLSVLMFRRTLGLIAVAPDNSRLVAVYRQPTGEMIAQVLDEAGHTALVAGARFANFRRRRQLVRAA